MNQLLTWLPWFRSVTTKDVSSTFDQHKSRTFVITAAMKVGRRVAISWSAVQQRTCRIRRQPRLKSWLVGFILYYQRGAEKTTRRRCFLFQLLNDTLDLIKLSFLKQSFMNCSVLRAEKLAVAEVVQNVPSRKAIFGCYDWWIIILDNDLGNITSLIHALVSHQTLVLSQN